MAMQPYDIIRIIRVSGLTVALFIGLSLPITYGSVAFNSTATSLEHLGQLSAGRAARYIFAHERMWQFQSVRLHEVIELPIAQYTAFRQSIMSSSGIEVYADTHLIPWPILTSQTPIIVAGHEVGKLVIETSIRSLIIEIVWITVASALAALFSLLIVHLWPIRLINRVLADLDVEQERTRSTLSQLEHADMALMARSEQLIEAQKLGRMGDWRMQIASTEFFVSAVVFDLLRLDPNTFKPTLAGIKSLLVKNSETKLERMIADAIRSRTSQSADVELQRGDGSIAFLAITCRPDTREDGKTSELVGTIQDISERREAEVRLESLAYFDPLTGLANRALFKRELAEVLERAQSSGHESALLLIDLDRFKEVNDTLGHAAGDELLRAVSRILGMVLESQHFIARLGGDEFAIIITRLKYPDQVKDIAHAVVGELGKPITLGQGEVRIGASIGIVMLPKDCANTEEATMHADLALYRAKENGRGQFAFFESAMSNIIQEKMALARDLRKAIAGKQELEAWFQPKISISDNRVIGFESLIRWKHPTRGFVAPSEFIPVAESSSLILDVGHWMLLQSARIAKSWIDAGHPPLEIAINVSAAQIWQSDIVEEIAAVLRDTGLPAKLLCIELTESMLADHAEGRVLQALTRLKALGVTLALDDFGTGYSSLGYLIQLPFDKLKIDRIFVAGAHKSAKMQHVLQGIIALGHGLGMIVVAEGVEEPEELALLQKFSCDQVQGYLFARPAPAEEAIAFAVNRRTRQKRAA
jgi:diguanylate cyclase (GGDEF)-like protein